MWAQGSLMVSHLSFPLTIDHLFQALYSPNTWPDAAIRIQLAIEGDHTPLFNYTIGNFDDMSRSRHDGSMFGGIGVLGADALRGYPDEPSGRNLTVAVARQKLLEVRNSTIHFGGLNMATGDVWPRSRRWEKGWRGPWLNQPSRPILVIANTVRGVCG
jgi:hypothetical protein